MSHAEERMSDAQDGPPRRPETTRAEQTTADRNTEPAPAGQDSAIADALLEPGPRRTRQVSLLVTEAIQVADGGDPANAAQPISSDVAEEFHERLDEHERDDLEPAWMVGTDGGGGK
jgi:hypothetical protein